MTDTSKEAMKRSELFREFLASSGGIEYVWKINRLLAHRYGEKFEIELTGMIRGAFEKGLEMGASMAEPESQTPEEMEAD